VLEGVRCDRGGADGAFLCAAGAVEQRGRFAVSVLIGMTGSEFVALFVSVGLLGVLLLRLVVRWLFPRWFAPDFEDRE
jgi:hypothetical protein